GSADIIAVLLPNGRDAVVAELAIAALGAVALPIPHTHGPRDIVRLLRRSRAAALVTTPEGLTSAEGVDDLQLWTPGPSPHDGIRSLDQGDLRARRREPVDAEAPARILTSSGSESEPKMVAYSHNAMGGGRGKTVAPLKTRRRADAAARAYHPVPALPAP